MLPICNIKEFISECNPAQLVRFGYGGLRTALLVKGASVLYVTYLLPGRDAVDEEFIMLSPHGKVLSLDNFYSPYKRFLGSHFCPVSRGYNLGKEDLERIPCQHIDGIISFAPSHPNWGHFLLDWIPHVIDIKNIQKQLGAENIMTISGQSIGRFRDSIKFLDFRYLGIHEAFNNGIEVNTCVVLKPEFLLMPLSPSRDEQISDIREYLAPYIKNVLARNFTEHKQLKGMLVNRAIKPRISTSRIDTSLIRTFQICTVDATRLNLEQTIIAFNRTKNVIIPLGAEVSNLIFCQRNIRSFVVVNNSIVTSAPMHKALVDTVYPLTTPHPEIILCPQHYDKDSEQAANDSLSLLDTDDILRMVGIK